jgi:hypothetical protein
VEHLGDPGAVLVVDETGDVKKGVLCRCRHNVPYDDRRIMPSGRMNVLVSSGYGA